MLYLGIYGVYDLTGEYSVLHAKPPNTSETFVKRFVAIIVCAA